MSQANKPPLQVMARTTDTDYWNDSCSIQELSYAIPNGAVGATTNPSIVYNVLAKELHIWEDRIKEIITDNPLFDEDQVSWQLIPATAAGIPALEEATYHGVNVNATVCFTVPQSIAVAEAIERRLAQREAEGKDIASMTPVCTIMVGRVDDWLKVVAENHNIFIDPAYLDLAGVAVMKRAAKIFAEKGYRARLLVAAYRNWNHVAELMGSNIIHTIPYKWQLRYNGSEMPIADTTAVDPDPQMIDVLKRNFEEFVKAYEPDGMTIEEFDGYGATRRTLRQFIGGYDSVVAIVRGLMIPDPDVE